MCGIAGMVYTHREGRADQATVRRMCAAIVHRGPDDEGIFVKGGIGLGMRRLSIIDLAGGHQPVFNEDKTVWIVYNGEVYNFPELRADLEKRGHRFSTHTDTETIVHLYEDLGADCVTKLRGMFAFALYDERRGKLLIARDRFGKKPLHYALTENQFLFGSEIKSILAVAPELASRVSQDALLQYLYFGYIPDPISAFQSIQKLPAGHLLELESGKIHVRQYWDLPEYGTHQPRSEEECLDELEWRLAEAVRIRLISDVPLGALLSGGTDSSTVVGLMARASSKPVKTFSIAFGHDDFNEARYARMVAQQFGTDHHELVVEPDILETVETLTRSLEEPFGDSSMLPTYYVSCMARKHVTVALSGDGGDEIFAGYDRYGINLRRNILAGMPPSAGHFYRKRIYPWLPKNMRGRRISYSVSLPWRERYVDSVSFLPLFEREIPLLSDEFREVLRDHNPEDVMYKYFDQAPAKNPVDQLLYVDTKTYMVGDILTKVDRMSMATSLEVRVPILDHLFVEWATGLPLVWKLRGKQQKYILRKLAERVGVPHQALYRPKQGFAMPLVHWIRHELKDLILSALLEPRTLQRGYFNPAGVRQLLDEHFRGHRDHSGGIWRLLMLELWHRNYLEKIPNGSAEPYGVTATGDVG